MDTTDPLELVALAIDRPTDMPDDLLDRLLEQLRSVRVRDAVLSYLVGYPDQARQILDGENPPARWIVAGPLDAAMLRRARPLLARLQSAGMASGPAHQAAPIAMAAYVEWACGEPVAAARHLTHAPAGYAFADLVRRLVGLGQPAPRLAQLEPTR